MQNLLRVRLSRSGNASPSLSFPHPQNQCNVIFNSISKPISGIVQKLVPELRASATFSSHVVPHQWRDQIVHSLGMVVSFRNNSKIQGVATRANRQDKFVDGSHGENFSYIAGCRGFGSCGWSLQKGFSW